LLPHILNVIRTIKHPQLELQALLHAEMPRLPGHFSINNMEPGRGSGNGTLT